MVSIRPDAKRAFEVDDWRLVRDERDRLLRDSDWTQLLNSPLTAQQVTAWATYRQKLRDIPTDFNKTGDIVWPETPR